MINPYFYYIIISNGWLYSYNFKRKKVIANPLLHLTSLLQSTSFSFIRTTFVYGAWGLFATNYDSIRLDEPAYLADMLEDLVDVLLSIKDADDDNYPNISTFKLSSVQWNNLSDRQRVLNWYNLYRSANDKSRVLALSDSRISEGFTEYLKNI